MAKKKKRRNQMPKLSALDKTIYWFIFLLLCVPYVAFVFVVFWLRNRIAFADAEVVAAKDHISLLWFLLPWMTFFLMTFILWYLPYQERRPIFGKRGIKYGPPDYPKIFPLFMKNKPWTYVSENKKKERKMTAIILLAILLVSFIPFPWSLYGRDCLRRDGSVVQYNMWDRQTHDFTSGEIKNVGFATYQYRSGKYGISRHYGVEMVLVTNSGREYTFEASEFRSDVETEYPYWLLTMINVKRRYDPGVIHYQTDYDLDLVIEDKNLTHEEAELLYQLFNQK